MSNNELNVFNGGQQSREQSLASVTSAMATTRQAQEVQAAMIVAKKFPRDEKQSCDRILNACMRQTLAENALYSFPRGGSEVTGPSIRLAECLAQNWGNIDFGFIELEQKTGESTVMAYAWDLETNTRQSKVFTVPHKRDTRNGSVTLTDSRDIYEMIANQSARRVRSCILSVIPGDVVDMAMKQCELALKAGNATPIEERIQNMISAYAEFEVTPEMLSGFIGKKVEAFTENDVVRLQKVYRSLKDGIVGNDYFIGKMRESVQEKPVQGELQNESNSGANPAKAAAKKRVGLDDL